MKKFIFLLCLVGATASAQKIVQLTDLHHISGTKSSAEALIKIGKMLDTEQPDLVVITGDVVVGEPMYEGWDEVLEVLIAREQPYAVVLGNHDDEQSLTRKQIHEYVARKPHARMPRHHRDYIINVGETDIYMMDSGGYAPPEIGGYAWFGGDQIEWFRTQIARRQNPALVFFHIPLSEWHELRDIHGTRSEVPCTPKINSGIFAAMVESGKVLGALVGHDHNNDFHGTLHGVILGYGRYSGGDNTYNDIGKGARVITLTPGARTFETEILSF